MSAARSCAGTSYAANRPRYYYRHKDLAGLQRLLGHADIRTTMHYVHLIEDLQDNVESAFADGLTIEEDTASATPARAAPSFLAKPRLFCGAARVIA